MQKLIVVSVASLFFADALKLNSADSQRLGPDVDSLLSAETKQQFGRYLSKFPRSFKNTDEYVERAKLYKKHKDEIDRFNKEDAKTEGYIKGENQFTAMTDEEYDKF